MGPGGLPNPTEYTIGRAGHPPHSRGVPVVTRGGVPVGVASVGASPRGLPRQNGSLGVELVLGLHRGDSKRQDESRWVELVLGLLHGDSWDKVRDESRWVELVLGLHHGDS